MSHLVIFYWDLIVLGNCLLLLHPFLCFFRALDQVWSISSAKTVTKLHDLWHSCIHSPSALYSSIKELVETGWKGANLCLLCSQSRVDFFLLLTNFFLLRWKQNWKFLSDPEWCSIPWASFTALNTVKVSQSHEARLCAISSTNDLKGWKFSTNTIVSWGSYSNSGAKESGV